MSDNFQPRIVGFLCNWCSYAGADLAGTSRLKVPANLRVVRVPCSGRINPLFIFKALEEGADGVMVSGCHPGDCHYISGNRYAKRKLAVLRRLLDWVGIEPERIHFTWLSASEGARYSVEVTEFVDKVRALGRRNPMAREGVAS
ncbi:MAG TPA: hydrogenase iron-sulfur subunit [Polyangia bacterium]|nr:hydrogenase iron-sulfur subunit [Polyangia bacterium]